MPMAPGTRQRFERPQGCGFWRRKVDGRFEDLIVFESEEVEEVEALRLNLSHATDELSQLEKESEREHQVQAFQIERQRVTTARWEEEACTAELKGVHKVESLVHEELQQLQDAANDWKRYEHPLNGEASEILTSLRGERASVSKAVDHLTQRIHALDDERLRLAGLMEQEAFCSSRSSAELAACAGEAMKLSQERRAVAARNEQVGRTQIKLSVEEEVAHSARVATEESAIHLEMLLESRARELDEASVRSVALERRCASLESECARSTAWEGQCAILEKECQVLKHNDESLKSSAVKAEYLSLEKECQRLKDSNESLKSSAEKAEEHQRAATQTESESSSATKKSVVAAAPPVEASWSAAEVLQASLDTEHLSCERLRDEVRQWSGRCNDLEFLLHEQQQSLISVAEEANCELEQGASCLRMLEDEQRDSAAHAHASEVSRRKLLLEVAHLREELPIAQKHGLLLQAELNASLTQLGDEEQSLKDRGNVRLNEAEDRQVVLQTEMLQFNEEALAFQQREAEVQAALEAAMVKYSENMGDKVELAECRARNESLVQHEKLAQRQFADLKLEYVKQQKLIQATEERCRTAESFGAKQRQVLQHRTQALEENRLSMARRLDEQAIVQDDLRGELASLHQELSVAEEKVASLHQEFSVAEERAQGPAALRAQGPAALRAQGPPATTSGGNQHLLHSPSPQQKLANNSELQVLRTRLEALEVERPDLMGRLAGAENATRTSKAESSKLCQLLSDERVSVESLEMRCQELLEERAVSLQITAGQNAEVSALRSRVESAEAAHRSAEAAHRGETARLRSELEMEARLHHNAVEVAASSAAKAVSKVRSRGKFSMAPQVNEVRATEPDKVEADATEQLWSQYSKRMAELQNLCSSGSRPESPLSIKNGTFTPRSSSTIPPTATGSPGTTPAATPRDHIKVTWTPTSYHSSLGDEQSKQNRSRSSETETTASSSDGRSSRVASTRSVQSRPGPSYTGLVGANPTTRQSWLRRVSSDGRV